ncbi:MAG: hypothetical protein M1829_006138 [Trizodia sp. TS-e1964]|nr:MAG: hypothetical protein M1829_006138 [Trizodia sp. TS-e1964]
MNALTQDGVNLRFCMMSRSLTILVVLCPSTPRNLLRRRSLSHRDHLLQVRVLQEDSVLRRERLLLRTKYSNAEPVTDIKANDENRLEPGSETLYVPNYNWCKNSDDDPSLHVSLMNSMCKGIKKSRGCDAEEMQLTYKPDSQSLNRPKMCPQGFCAPENVECDPARPDMPCNPYANYMTAAVSSYSFDQFHLTCDEFPFAASAQGGTPSKGTSICIPGWQNSFQGGKLKQLSRKVGANNDYIIQVTGWDCKGGKPKPGAPSNCGGKTKRDEILGYSLTQDDFFMNFTDSGQNALLLYLGDVNTGVYNYTLDIGSGTFTKVLAIDYQGNTLASVPNGIRADSKPQTVSFQLTEPVYGVALWVYTSDATVA